MNNPFSIIQGLLTDYVNLLKEAHPTSAQIVSASANSALRTIIEQAQNAEDRDQ